MRVLIGLSGTGASTMADALRAGLRDAAITVRPPDEAGADLQAYDAVVAGDPDLLERAAAARVDVVVDLRRHPGADAVLDALERGGAVLQPGAGGPSDDAPRFTTSTRPHAVAPHLPRHGGGDGAPALEGAHIDEAEL